MTSWDQNPYRAPQVRLDADETPSVPLSWVTMLKMGLAGTVAFATTSLIVAAVSLISWIAFLVAWGPVSSQHETVVRIVVLAVGGLASTVAAIANARLQIPREATPDQQE